MRYNVSISKFPNLEEALEKIGGIEKYVNKDAKVLIKPNVCVPKKNETGAVTNPQLIFNLIKLIQPLSRNIFVGECPIRGFKDLENLKASGVFEKVIEAGGKIVNLNQDEKVKLGDFYIAKSILNYDVIINMPVMKTHERTGVSLSLKNIMGIVPGKQKRAMHSTDLDRRIIDLNLLVKPTLIIVDANNCQEGSGPISGNLKKIGLTIVGDNSLAVDLVCCKIMGIDPSIIKHLRIAMQKGLGPKSMDDINIIGLKQEYFHKFSLPVMYSSNIVRFSKYNFYPILEKYFGKINRIEFDWSKCKRCNLCVYSCSKKIIKMTKNGPIYDNKKCILCLCCFETCLSNAIKIKRPILRFWLLNMFNRFKKILFKIKEKLFIKTKSEKKKIIYILTYINNIMIRFIPGIGWNIIHLQTRTMFPKAIYVEITNYCDAVCIMCPRDKLTRSLGFMGEELYKKIINECAIHKEFKWLTLHGFGESLLDKNFVKKIKYAKEKNIPITRVCTTASLLTEDVGKELILSGLDHLKISFFGTTKKEYESTHRNLIFERSINNIRRFLKLKKELRTKKPYVKINYLIDPRKSILKNIYLCLKFYIQWTSYLKVDYSILHNFGVGRDYNKVHYKGDVIKCHYPFRNQIHILWNGDICPCPWDYDGSIKFGNIYESSIKDIWLGSEYQRFRTAHKNKDFNDYPMCERCDIWALPWTKIYGPIPK
jgi:radical SAM protein with 4Fe4S-binding SPASM domain